MATLKTKKKFIISRPQILCRFVFNNIAFAVSYKELVKITWTKIIQ